MRQFDSILKRYGVLTEQSPDAGVAALGDVNTALQPPAQGGAQSAAPSSGTNPPGAESIDNQKAPEEKKSLNAENYTLMVKLLKAAFLANPDEEDSATVNNMKFQGADGNETTDINENNADEAFNKLLPVISKYLSKDKTVESLLKKV